MNRALFITIGIVLILFVFLLWLFFFFYGAPNNTQQVFSDLGIIEGSGRTVEPIPEGGIDENSVVLDLSDGQLQQITTDPVAGYGVASSSDSREFLRYVERGTGRIYEINLSSGLKTLVTPTTVPGAVTAYFSPELTSAVVVTDLGNRQVTLLKLPEDSDGQAERFSLLGDVENIEYLDEKTLAYTQNSYKNTVGYTHNLDRDEVAQRFNLALPDAVVETNSDNEVFAYPKPAAKLNGVLYKVQSGLTPLSESELGLVAFIGDGNKIINYIEEDSYLAKRLSDSARQAILMLPEKCVGSVDASKIWCGAPYSGFGSNYVDDWHKGTLTSNDWLWEMSPSETRSVLLAQPTELIGRQLDIVNLATDTKGEKLFFQNKTDTSLWLFRF